MARFDAKRLDAIDAFVAARYLDSGKLPHAQLLVAAQGEVVHFSHQGPARETGGDVNDRSIFRIASMTKPVTSTQLSPSNLYPIRREIKTMIYAALN